MKLGNPEFIELLSNQIFESQPALVKVLRVFIWAELMPVIPPVMLLELILEVCVFQKELEIDPIFPPANGFAVQLAQTTVPVEYELDTLLTDQLLPINPPTHVEPAPAVTAPVE